MDLLTSNEIIEWFKSLQDEICGGLESLDGSTMFVEDLWTRKEGGGGRTRIIEGIGIEKGGVNFSAVDGPMPAAIARGLNIEPNHFLATGVSIVLHPTHPLVPIIHMNIRYFEMDNGEWWFGGGIDLTPHIVFPEDAIVFHKGLKIICDDFSSTAYDEFKEWADNYFYIPHREETRGVGGIFFDRLNESYGKSKIECWKFLQSVGKSFLGLYGEIYQRNSKKEYTDSHKYWQMIRRGRYVEFNLVYDRGTKFGLQTNGRIESILMSLPPVAHYKYQYVPSESFEISTQKNLKKGIDWINYKTA